MERQLLVAQVAQALVAGCPPGWRGAQVVHRQAGARVEQEAAVLTADGTVALVVPDGLVALFAELRAEGPLWFTARVRAAPPDRFTLDTDDGEPALGGGRPGWRELAADPAVRSATTRPGWVDTLLADAVLSGPAEGVLAETGPGTGTGTGGADLTPGAVPGGAGPAGDVVPADGPLQPLPGEPPLSLLRRTTLVTVPAGTEVDRLGDGAGNVVWLARTPWPQRSLPPEYAGRPYAAYVLRRGVQALVGETVPWFGQPGGGTAFVLARSLDELVALGAVEQLV